MSSSRESDVSVKRSQSTKKRAIRFNDLQTEIKNLKDQVKGFQEFILSQHSSLSMLIPISIDIRKFMKLRHKELTK
jgi:hypothetical protein